MGFQHSLKSILLQKQAGANLACKWFVVAADKAPSKVDLELLCPQTLIHLNWQVVLPKLTLLLQQCVLGQMA